MANFVRSVTRFRNAAGTAFRLKNVEGYGWELHSVDDADQEIDFYGGFDRKADAVRYADDGKALRPARGATVEA